jgi:hypothetical protein
VVWVPREDVGNKIISNALDDIKCAVIFCVKAIGKGKDASYLEDLHEHVVDINEE